MLAVFAIACGAEDGDSGGAAADRDVPLSVDTGNPVVDLGARSCALLVEALMADAGYPDVILRGSMCGDSIVLELLPLAASPAATARVSHRISVPSTVPEARVVLFVCRVRSVADPAVVAIAQHADIPVFNRIERAWRLGGDPPRTDSIPADGVSCANEAYGL